LDRAADDPAYAAVLSDAYVPLVGQLLAAGDDRATPQRLVGLSG
jgi:hypothetical protein